MSQTQSQIKQSHNLTAEEMEELRQLQSSDEPLPKVKASTGDKALPNVFKHERHLVHALIRVPQYDPLTGEDLSVAQVQKFDPKEFTKMTNEQAFAGRRVTVLHDGNTKTEDVHDTEPEDSLTPQVVSQPGAGIDLTEDYSKYTAAELKGVWKKLNPDTQDEPPTTKKELLEEITARVAFLGDERKRQELEQTEQTRLTAAGAGTGQ